jgi:secreted trypsin-like serine protease
LEAAVRKGFAVVLLVLAGLVSSIGTAHAITFGKPDGSLHPNVGALLADYDPESPGPDILCTGTLIDEKVFLTAAHCTAFLESEGISQVWVTFAPQYDEDSTSLEGLFAGTYVTHPEFGSGGASNPHDIAVVLLEQSPGIAPAQLPTAGLLDQLKASHQLDDQTFTAVGYGTVREDKRTGPHAFFFDGIRRYALQSALNLEKSWLLLSMQPSTGDGGACYGDSGGPHFLGGVESNLIVSITVTGDAMCRATDKTYRLDTASAREFLDDFVTLP